MLQIRLNKGSTGDGGGGSIGGIGGGGGGGKSSQLLETVTVACPDHLILADLPVAKGLGSATGTTSTVKIVGRKSRRQLAERVHFCVRCDFPIAIYGRLNPCEHAFCLDCARSDSICYLCDDRIQKIQTIKMMEGIFICAAPHCLKSFLKKSDFESHIHDSHGDLLHPNMKREETNEPDVSGTKQSSTLDTTARGPSRSGFPPNLNDRDDKARRLQPPARPIVPPKPPQFGQGQPSEPQPDNRGMGTDGSGQLRMPHQGGDSQGGMQQDVNQFSDKQQPGIMPGPHGEYPPMYPQQPPNFPMPMNSNPGMLAPPPFGFPPFQTDGAPPYYNVPGAYEVSRPDSMPDPGSDQGSAMGFTPGPGGSVSFPEGYSRPWIGGPSNNPFEAMQGGQGPQGMMGGGQAMPPPPPPQGSLPPNMMQHNHGHFPGDMSNDGKNYGWQTDRRDGFESSQD